MHLLGAVLVAFVQVQLSAADQEHVAHGAASARFRFEHQAAGHNEHADHQAVLGSKKAAQDFDNMPPEESKKRLAVIAKRMDTNKDGFVDESELTAWIHSSMLSLDKEESTERYVEMDTNKDGFVTWKEYLQDAFGDLEGGGEEIDPDDQRLIYEDKEYFKTADLNGDDRLSEEEFDAFQNPEHYRHMNEILVKMMVEEKDTNRDGKIDMSEFLGDMAENVNSEWYKVEKNRFIEEYDKDGDGFLQGDELYSWLIPDLKLVAEQESDHLIAAADTNKDGRLTVEEIVNEHALFVGSEATRYGERLAEVPHEEL